MVEKEYCAWAAALAVWTLSASGEGTGAFGFPNLIANPSFERSVCRENGGEFGRLDSPRTSSEGWTGRGCAHVIRNGSPVSSTFRPDGGNWLGIVQTWKGRGCSLEQSVVAPKSGTYVLSFDCARSATDRGTGDFSVRLIEGAATNRIGTVHVAPTAFRRVRFKVPLVGRRRYTLAFQSEMATNFTALIDDISLELPDTPCGRLISDAPDGFDEIIFATRSPPLTPLGRPEPHWYANFGYYSSGPQHPTCGSVGRLAAYNFRTGKFRTLLEDVRGSIRDPAVHYDGRTILFAYRPGGTAAYHLYTINADGTGLKQLTSGPYDDIEPAWLPDGDIAFCSARARRWVNCWITQVATIFRMKPDGSGIRPLSANIEQDNTPCPLPDGRLIYTRWEYVDRQQMAYHHLWTMNPDGTHHRIYQGNTYPNSVYIDARPIPDSDEVVLIDSSGHGRAEHAGNICLLDAKSGPDNRANVRTLVKGKHYDPWPISRNLFMFSANGKTVELTDRSGSRQTLFALPPDWTGPRHDALLFEPRPLRPHARERILTDRTNPVLKTGEFYLENVLESRSMTGVKPGTIKKLMIYELLPKPINFHGGAHHFGGMEPFSFSGTFSLPRQLGTVPVEADGSAYFTVPALRSLFFVALDAEGRAVKRMQSFTQVMPGEKMGCVGCHESKTASTVRRVSAASLALRRGPSAIDSSGILFDVADFPRDVQPVLDRACVKCHNPDTRRGGLDLSGDRNAMFSMGYYGLVAWNQVYDGRNLTRSDWPPYARGSGGSPLLRKIDGSHHGVTLAPRDRRLIMQWLDASAPYAGTYAAGGCGYVGGEKSLMFHNETGKSPATQAAREVMARRCDACHNTSQNRLPHALTDERDHFWQKPSTWTIDLGNPRLKHYHRYLVFNLSQPEKSLFLKAPLAKEAGGFGTCRTKDGKGVFASTDDPDYKVLLAMIAEGKDLLEKETRFDMPNFRPAPEYIREMIRYGILPKDFDLDKTPVNVYDLDRRYWNIDWTTVN